MEVVIRPSARPTVWAWSAAACMLASCGGGGGTPTSASSPTSVSSSQLAQQCDPSNPLAADASKSGSLGIEKQWLRAYMDEAYLWFDQVPAVDPSASLYSSPMGVRAGFNVPLPLDNYFQALKTPQLSASGARVDKFSFTYSTADWNAYSQAGQSVGYGAEIALLSRTVPRRAVVAYVEPNSPATNAAAGLKRGVEILSIDGVDLVNDASQTGANAINAGLFPLAGSTHSFVVRDPGASATRSVVLTAQLITRTPVLNVQTLPSAGGRVGYLQFNDHILASEQMLIDAFARFKAEQVQDLVLDMRYNGGGYLYIASALAYMVAGPARTSLNGQSQVFEKLSYNSKRAAENNAMDFHATSCLADSSFNCTQNAALPSLDLARVYILTQAGTCSASESVVNGLRGIGVDVRIVGGTTCGKPYGFTAKDNCGVSYFPIEFKGVNAAGFGDYSDGFTPNCAAADDFSKQLGDPLEGQLAAALKLQSTGTCPVAAAPLERALSAGGAGAAYALARSPLRENRWLRAR